MDGEPIESSRPARHVLTRMPPECYAWRNEPMSPTEITIEILESIRDEVRATNTRLDATNTRLDETNTRIVESELRTASAITDLHGTVRDLVDVLREQHDWRPRVDRCERDIGDIKRRFGP
jgi:hypothetical protein